VKAIVITRDRLNYTLECMQGLVSTPGIDEVHLIDHGSTYGPMIDWLGKLGGANWHRRDGSMFDGRVHVHWRGNAHPRDLFAPPGGVHPGLADIIEPGERFVLTDCDIEPPADPGWLEHLGALLDANPDAVKAGCGLITDDLPDHFEHADRVRMWEANYQGFNTLRRDKTSGLAWYDASVDTTLALYRELGPFALDPSVRSADARFMARHLTWYEASANPTPEVEYYRAHALNGVSMWADPDNYQGTYALPDGA
jgi:hypothetical protein